MTGIDSSPWAGWVCETIEEYHTERKPKNMKLTKDTMKSLLSDNILEVKFTKKDGDIRIMKCTTVQDLIPEEFKSKGVITEDVHPTQVRAFDLNANGWRSFLSTNIIEVSILDN